MSILTFSNLGLAYGDFDVFVGLNGGIPNDAKIGLVGANGIGKTSLISILAGVAQPTSGGVAVARAAAIGYLRQEAMEAFAGHDNTLMAEMLTVFDGLRQQEARLRQLEASMADGAHPELMTVYATEQEAFERAGGYDYEVRIGQVLFGLGFGKHEWKTPLNQLSGGQKTRALLARLLLEQPNLLILDEPTNHLDVEAVEWLEGTLKSWPGALLMVSHDRYFLDRVVNRIWEMGSHGIEEYRGNYSAYLQQRQERWERREADFLTIKERFLSELDYIKRNIDRDATNAQAVGRLRRLIRQVRVVEAGGLQVMLSKNWGEVMEEVDISEAKWGVEDVEQAIKALRSPLLRPPRLNMHLKTNLRSGNLVLRSNELAIGYAERQLFMVDPILLERGECAALIGPNGSGKTTFLKTILRQIEPLRGELRLGASLRLGYFAQAHDKLHPEKSVLEELLDHRNLPLREARNYLAQYLFRGEDVYKPVAALSGGERGRLALALLALDGANFLLLDEPTNHLDIPAQEVLQEVLENFEGTILLVSHDRYLIDHLATQIWELRAGRLHIFLGTYSEFVAARTAAREREQTVAAQQRQAVRQEQRSDRQSKNEERKRYKALAESEARVHGLEAQLAALEQALQAASDRQDLAAIEQFGQDYTATQHELDAAFHEWLELAG
jgi:ATP-binding cassette subfamily F protein 3